MKRVTIVQILLMACCLNAYTQTDTGKLVAAQERGIVFLQNLTWADVLQKAKAENKYIFVDCYASWCGPCKWMDGSVYSSDAVGKMMNDKFLCVRLQMDSTSKDQEEVKNWYSVAHQFAEQYHIIAYPTYLFFSPDGYAVHKDVGVLDLPNFIALTETAKEPKKQFYVLLSHYRQKNNEYAEMPYLASAAEKAKEDSLSSCVATDYIHHYLELLPITALWTKGNVQFIGNYSKIIHSGDRIFRRYFESRKTIDSVMDKPGYADRLINFIAYNEEVKPIVSAGIKKSMEPNWHKMEKQMKRKYGLAYAGRQVLKGRVEYYRARKEWGNYSKYFVREMRMANIQNWPSAYGSTMTLNNDAFEIFKYSNKKNELEAALSWINRAISMEDKPGANEMDTKANILYKLGRKSEALELEDQSRHLSPDDKEIQTAYDKMRHGAPTWQ